jgi:hypothetical protein
MPAGGYVTLTTLATFRDPWEAHMFRGRLEAEGIPAIVSLEQHIWVNWPLSTALGGARVQIPDGFTEPGRVVLEGCVSGLYTEALEGIFGDIELTLCPACGSRDVRRRPTAKEFIFGLAITFLVAAAKVDARNCKCRRCGARWRIPQ